MGCKHNFVSSGYGNDLICTKCGYAAMQAVATMPVKESIQEPALREKMKIPLNTGDGTEMISVYKDELEKELKRALGLDLSYNIMNNAIKNSR